MSEMTVHSVQQFIHCFMRQTNSPTNGSPLPFPSQAGRTAVCCTMPITHRQGFVLDA